MEKRRYLPTLTLPQGNDDVRDARFCAGQWQPARRQPVVVAARGDDPHYRPDVFPDPAAPAEADEGAPGPGEELAPRRYRGYVRRAGREGHQSRGRGADRG